MRNLPATMTLSLLLPGLASASQIGVGLDWRHNVFVQEFWQDGKARYAIYNNRPEAIKLTASDVEFVTVPGTESFRAVEGKELASWEVKSKEVVIVDAPKVPAGVLRFLRFRVGAVALGVLTPPRAAPADLPKDKIASYDGINGSGGRRSRIEQDTLTFKAGGVIELKLHLPASSETITFKKKKSIDNLTEALISEIECDTLPIEAGKEEIAIHVGRPKKAVAAHTVTLRFQAPKVEAPTMVVIDGWVTIPPEVPGTTAGGYHAVRGIVVQPEK